MNHGNYCILSRRTLGTDGDASVPESQPINVSIVNVTCV